MKPKILVISHIHPIPANSGQKMRVQNTLKYLMKKFDVTYLSFCKESEKQKNINLIKKFSTKQIFLNSIYNRNIFFKSIIKLFSLFFSFFTGLKSSNFLIGEVEFSWFRLKKIIENGDYDIVLIEYFHAFRVAKKIRKYKVPVVLDTHNILWKSFEKQLIDKNFFPKIFIKLLVNRYKKHEESAWNIFDHVIAINRSEEKYIKSIVSSSTTVSFSGMGVDTAKWQPINPNEIKDNSKKLMYYGSLNSSHNQRDALITYFNIFKKIELEFTNVEFWIVGSSPSKKIINIGDSEKNVFVTGFIDEVEKTISKMDFAIIPWSGKYGFRSRIIEIMSAGVPVVTSYDAVDGMMLKENEGLFLCNTIDDFIKASLKLIEDESFRLDSRSLARKQVLDNWDMDKSYRGLTNNLYEMIIR